MCKFLLEDFKKLPIWQQYEIKNKKSYPIDKLVSNALVLLDRYYEAFPKYTLHNRQHQYNVLKLIGELLGHELIKLKSLECTLIILAVVYHDIGMVFSEKELDEIENEPSFQRFLSSDYKATLSYQEDGSKVNADLAQW